MAVARKSPAGLDFLKFLATEPTGEPLEYAWRFWSRQGSNARWSLDFVYDQFARDAVRTLADKVGEMKSLTDDYRERRAGDFAG